MSTRSRRLHAKVLSITRVQQELPDMRRYRLVLIDESHNLRNREGKRRVHTVFNSAAATLIVPGSIDVDRSRAELGRR